ncbi:MAG: putative uracil-DNA glycosylase [Rhodospirillaceae bacterium]|nr:MAG: putative uracil-DNA glycosylase [Rhodospirillaceae bacterium]
MEEEDGTARQLAALMAAARACRVCAAHLPLGPRPVLCGHASARLLIIGQAPGKRVHKTGLPWNDASGERLRQWLDIDRDTFYDEVRIAIIPIGLCYPGRDARGGDRVPRPECAPLWHPPLRAALPFTTLTLLVGRHAQTWYLGARGQNTMTATVAAWRTYLPAWFPLPHPSWRNTAWPKRHPWFAEELIPALRQRVHDIVKS